MKTFVGLVILVSGILAHADGISPLMSVAYEGGGDQLVKVTYSDGSTSEINAGQGLMLTGGVILDLTQNQPHKVELQSTIGWKFASTKKATNGELTWTRFPIDLVTFYRSLDNNYRVGAGITYHFANDFKGTDQASVYSTKVDNALGFLVQGDYFFGEERKIGVGARGSFIKYKGNGVSASGNSIGVHLTYVWW